MPDTPVKEPYYGDLSKTSALSGLFSVEQNLRDENWHHEVMENITDASFASGDPQLMHGPDGFPYFHVLLPQPQQSFECFVLRHMVGDFLLTNGWGVVVNLRDGQPDWVFSYGDIVNFHLRQEFYTASDPEAVPAPELGKDGEEMLMGQPSQAYLPGEARNVMRQYLESHGLQKVKIALLTRRTPKGVAEQLVFNLTAGQFESAEHYDAFMRTLAWFLPRHYLYAAMSDAHYAGQFDLL